MQATLVAIESGVKFTDGQRRFTFRLADADTVLNEIRIAEDKLPVTMLGAQLDYVVEVTLKMAVSAKFTPDAHLDGCDCPNCADVRNFQVPSSIVSPRLDRA